LKLYLNSIYKKKINPSIQVCSTVLIMSKKLKRKSDDFDDDDESYDSSSSQLSSSSSQSTRSFSKQEIANKKIKKKENSIPPVTLFTAPITEPKPQQLKIKLKLGDQTTAYTVPIKQTNSVSKITNNSNNNHHHHNHNHNNNNGTSNSKSNNTTIFDEKKKIIHTISEKGSSPSIPSSKSIPPVLVSNSPLFTPPTMDKVSKKTKKRIEIDDEFDELENEISTPLNASTVSTPSKDTDNEDDEFNEEDSSLNFQDDEYNEDEAVDYMDDEISDDLGDEFEYSEDQDMLMDEEDEAMLEFEPHIPKGTKKDSSKDTKKKLIAFEQEENDFNYSQKVNTSSPNNSGKKLTARQKALYQGDKNGELLALPIGKKEESKEMTEEMLLKKSENARRRKMMQQRQQEQEKASTIEKLLKKQTSSRLKKEEEKRAMLSKGDKNSANIRYISGPHGNFLSFASSIPVPAELYQISKRNKEIKVIYCAAPGCKNVKKYADKESTLPLCSLNCYKNIRNTDIFKKAVSIKH